MIIEFEGLKLEILEGVYIPSDDSYLLIENLNLKSDDLVLEIGTGSGIVALYAAMTGKKVVATDISPIAVKCAKNNVKKNQLESKVEIRIGNLFDPIRKEEIFDLILFNAPYLPETKDLDHNNTDWLEKTWNGGKTGRKLIDPFITHCKKYLTELGRVELVQSSLANIPKSCELFHKQGFQQVEISASKSFFFEKIVILEAKIKINFPTSF